MRFVAVREESMKDKELDFEQALAALEKTVEKLETGGLALNESLALFEKGVKLARFLRAELDKAEKKVEILLKDDQGGIRAEPFSLDEDGAGGGADEEGEAKSGTGADAPEKKVRSRAAKKRSEGGDDELPF
jgi:exodeoxyribonuclease VII small subunit